VKTVTVDIKHRFSGEVLFSAEVDASIGERFRLRAALEMGVKARANLAGAYLARAYLDGANLARAYLAGANLAGANLARAYLAGANLDGANLAGANLARAYLAGANLDGANLDGANLDGANLAGAKLIGERPIFQLGPIGSESRYFVAYITDKGLRLKAGCFFGTLAEFEAKLSETHGDNVHAKEYRAALAMIGAHADLWTPEAEAEGRREH
jgi:hypothetical protein